LPRGTTARATIAGAVAAAGSRATDRRGHHPATGTGRATGVAEAFVMGGITSALLVGRRIVAKDGCAPVSTAPIAGQGQASAAQTEDAAKGRGGDSFEGLAPRGRCHPYHLPQNC
jgi:hypothetical protein